MAELFEVAVKVVNEFGAAQETMSNQQALEIYGLYKQATVGDNSDGRPGIFNQKGRAKWDAWEARKGMSQDQAKAEYVEAARRNCGGDWAARIAQ